MEKVTIIYPAIAMFVLTVVMLFTLGFSRFIAIKKRQVSIKFYRHYNQGEQPDRLHVLMRHVQNHFEVPPLFYIGIILTFVTDSVSTVTVVAAWLFFGLRCLHSYIHLGSNNVNNRFFCFGASLMALTVLWVAVFINILSTSGL